MCEYADVCCVRGLHSSSSVMCLCIVCRVGCARRYIGMSMWCLDELHVCGVRYLVPGTGTRWYDVFV